MEGMFKYTVDEAVNKEALERKIKGIDFKTLAGTTMARFEALVEDPIMTVLGEDQTRRFLEGCESFNTGRFIEDDYRVLLQLLQTLCATVVIQHLKELTSLETSRGKRPVEGFKVRLSGSIYALVRSSGVHPVVINASSHYSLDKLLGWTLGGKDMLHNTLRDITYTKMILELLVMDDHTPEAVEAYAESQHDWCLSSIMEAAHLSLDCKVYENRFVTALVTALVHGCQNAGRGGTNTRLMDVYTSDAPQPDRKDMIIFCNSVARISCGIRHDGGDCYDPVRLESLVSKACSFGDGAIMWGVSRPDDEPVYHRFVGSYVYRTPNNMPNMRKFPCRIAGLPEPERVKITRDLLMELEGKTRFIKNSILRGALDLHYQTCVDLGLLVKDCGRIDPKALRRLFWDKARVFRNCHTNPYLFSKDRGVIGDGASGPWTEITWNLLDVQCVLQYSGQSKEGGISPQDRYLAFMKLYLLHKIVRLNECLPEADKDFKVTPFEKLVIDDVLHSMDDAHSTGLICLDEDSKWYKDFTDGCVSICGDPELADALHDPDGTGRRGSARSIDRTARVMYNDLEGLYHRMSSGDLKDLEERFEQLDEAMISAVIDNFLVRQVGQTGGMPEEFVLEDLRMDVLSRYEAVASGL